MILGPLQFIFFMPLKEKQNVGWDGEWMTTSCFYLKNNCFFCLAECGK